MTKKKNLFESFSNWATNATGSSAAFIIAALTVVVWAATGPVAKYSETWQLIINTGTTIITFLMVFLIQKAQNKDSKAIHLKLNEILASHEGTSNRMVDIENLTEADLDHLHKFYARLSKLAEEEDDLTCTHSIDAADENHQTKQGGYRKRKTYTAGRSGQPSDKDVITPATAPKKTTGLAAKAKR